MLCDACHTKARKNSSHTPDHLLQVSHYVNMRFPGCTTQYCQPSHAAVTPAANQHNLEYVTLWSFRGPYASIFVDMAVVVVPPKPTGRLRPCPAPFPLTQGCGIPPSDIASSKLLCGSERQKIVYAVLQPNVPCSSHCTWYVGSGNHP